ncbi:transcription factor TFIIIC subunit tfc4 [Linnemannia exigua]|uniref:Transcription factor TFIIIC subunit tfc4 n=1 Tax=Linnemannia exigua TaxID=604196 RepID=A0AAD4DC25_9FUNG|nr:transcription factor TFIIIC subunit tfc4 [Linnemannia exigua]
MDSGQGAGERSSKKSGKPTASHSNVDAHSIILADLEATFMANQEQNASASVASSSGSNPLFTRLNQNSVERAHVAAVGYQLGPEGALAAPRVIGDFVGLHSSIDDRNSINNNNNGGAESMSEALSHIGLGGLDDAYNDLDVFDGEDDEEVDGDIGLHFSQGLSLQAADSEADRARKSKGKQVVASTIATSVDPMQLYGAIGEGSSTPWEIAAGLEPSIQDDDEDELDLNEDDPAIEELGLALAPKSKREKKKLQKKGTVTYPPEVQKLLGLANNAYVNRDYDQAVDYFQQVIVTHPNVFQAWNIMGVIQEELGNTEKALQLYLVAAHLTPKDGALWKKLAVISKECGYDQQALYCFTRAFRADKNDMDALWDRSIMYQILNEPYKAIQGFQKVLKVKHHYMPALEELVKLYSSLDQDNKKYRENMHQAMLDYEAAYLHYSSLPDKFSNNSTDPFDVADMDYESQQSEPFGYSALNMLSELYIMFEEYEKPIDMIKTWSRRLQRRSHQTWWDDYKDDREFDTEPDDEELQASLGENRTRGLPIDLRVKLGICRLMMEEVKEAKTQFKYLWRCSVEDFPDLYEEIAELYVTKQMWKDGYNVIRAMLQYDEMDIPKIWIMAGECLRHMRQFKEAKDYLEQAHRADPESVELSMMLAEVYEETGQLQQALKLANFVRRVNAEKQAEADQRRKEAKAIRDAKSKDGPSTPRTPATPSYLLDNHGYRELAPRQTTTSDAARNALARITEASRSRTAAERYDSADRDRDIQYVRAAREQERADKLAGREFHTQELREVIEKFNRVDVLFQRINEKEKSRVWENKRDAVECTREDRTQYIQVARDLIDLFMGNRSFFVKEKMKPYMGTETRAWRFRRSHKEDQDVVLSEHAAEMSERLGRMMGLAPPKPTIVLEPVEAAPRAPATTYKDVSFDAWYLLMIRQAVYLTFENRYEEAIDLLMIMYSANVFYQVPRRRSGIMLVVLSCSMWVGDYDAIINAGRWLCNFGGIRPFALKLFQSIFTHGPRGHQRFFAWVQANTYKYLKRNIDTMRTFLGSKSHTIRKIRKHDRKARVGPKRRGPRKSFPTLNPSLASPKKRIRGDTEASPVKTAAFPWRGASNVFHVPVTIAEAVTVNSSRQSTRSRLSNIGVSTAAADEDPFMETRTPDSTSNSHAAGRETTEESTTVAERLPKAVRPRVTFAEAGNSGSESAVAPYAESEEAAVNIDGRVLRRKRRLEAEDPVDTATEDGGEGEDDDEEDQDEEDDDDDYDINDEAYKTDEEEGKEAEVDPEEYETEWDQDDSGFPRSSATAFGKRRGGPLSGTGDYADEFEDDDEGTGRRSSRGTDKGGKKKSASWRELYNQTKDGQDEFGEDQFRTPSRGMRMFTKDVYPKFHLSLVMFMGHILSHSRTHTGAAIHYAECMEYAPKNPMIQLYLAVQLFNLAMQRTTSNRQMVMGQALVFLQNYYHMRRAGYGSIAFAEREKQNKAQGKAPGLAVGAPVFPVIASKSADWKEQAAMASTEAVRANPSAAYSTSTSKDVSEASSSKTTPAIATRTAKPVSPAKPSESPSANAASSPSSGSTTEPQLVQCQQEAEYNFARAFHQIGQKSQAIIHYRRVLELPSWREVEREQEAMRKKQEQAQKESHRQRRAEARSAAIERKMERAHNLRELQESKRVLMEEVKKQRLEEKAARAEVKAKAAAESGVLDAAVAEAEDDMEVEEMGEDLDEFVDGLEDEDEDLVSDDERQGDEASTSSSSLSARMQLQGEEDEDPTDLKREAAYNLAKIYMLSGAMGEAQQLMRKYCTL